MLRDIYKQYIRVSRGISKRSVRHYITGINSINSLLAQYGFPITDVFSVNTIEELDSIVSFLRTNDEFIKKDSVGHNMYSVALKHFYRFASEDDQFFSSSIQQIDIPIVAPDPAQFTTLSWKRNQIIKAQAIKGAHYLCENDNGHMTFTSKATGRPYMEGHHLIPVQFQKDFDTSIDVYANVVSLCPICHRLLHFGADNEKTYMAEKLFDTRSKRLINCGIDLSKREFLRLVI